MLRQRWAVVASAWIAGGAFLCESNLLVSAVRGQHTGPALQSGGRGVPIPVGRDATGQRIEIQDLDAPEQRARGSAAPIIIRAGLTVGIVGKVHQPGVYRFEATKGDLATLIKAAGGLTAEASDRIRIVRGSSQAKEMVFHPQVPFHLMPGDMIVIGGRVDPRNQAPDGFDSLGRPTYPATTGKTSLSEETQAVSREQSVANIAVLGVEGRPLVLRLPAGEATLAEVLTRLNQSEKSPLRVTIWRPGAAPQVVRASEARQVGLTADTLCLFEPDKVDRTALPEFAEPVVIPGDGSRTQERAVAPNTPASARSRPIVMHSPFAGKSRAVEPQTGRAVGSHDRTSPLESRTPPALASAPEQADIPEIPSESEPTPGPATTPRLSAPAAGDLLADLSVPESSQQTTRAPELPPENTAPAPALPSLESAPTELADLPTLRQPETAESGVGSIRVIPEAPIQIPNNKPRRLTDESHLSRQPLSPELARGEPVSDKLVPLPMEDIDELSAGGGTERLGMWAAGLAVLASVVGVTVVIFRERRRRDVAVKSTERTLSRLDALIEDRLEIHEEPSRLPENLVLYGSPVPQGDRYFIDPPEELPAPHFSQPAETRPSETSVEVARSSEPTTPAGEGTGKVMRLDGSHPGADKGTAGRSDLGLLDRALLKQRGNRS